MFSYYQNVIYLVAEIRANVLFNKILYQLNTNILFFKQNEQLIRMIKGKTMTLFGEIFACLFLIRNLVSQSYSHLLIYIFANRRVAGKP